MSLMPTAAAKKLAAHLRSELDVWHHDAKAGFTLVLINDRKVPRLLQGLDDVPGVALVTAPHDSLHWGGALVRVNDFPAFLGDATGLDERAMRWKADAWAEASRFGRRVLVAEGGNNMRNLRSVGLTFDDEAEAKRFFASFQRTVPRGWVDTGPVAIAGRGGIMREYLGSDEMRKGGLHAAIVDVLDETFSLTRVDPKGDRATERTRFATPEAALAALNAFEFDWFRRGGVQHEVEYMASLKPRAERTLHQHVQAELDHVDDPRAFVATLLREANLTLPAELPDDRYGLRRAVDSLHEAHWLRVGERLEPGVVHHAVMNRPGVHVYLDRAHLTVAVVTAAQRTRNTGADVKRVEATKYDALVQKVLKKYALA